jgi:membrane-associated phospholipid phosphatase
MTASAVVLVMHHQPDVLVSFVLGMVWGLLAPLNEFCSASVCLC